MSITVNTQVTPQENLPQLIKQSSTYRLFVPKKVEEKIRYLIRKFPNTEWSGVLFIKHTGSFEEGNLVITCEDLYPMDLGTTGWTEFKMNEVKVTVKQLYVLSHIRGNSLIHLIFSIGSIA